MHILKLLHNLLNAASKKIDKRIHNTLLAASFTLSEHKQLSIFGLGRHLESKAQVKHNIKRIDRLFGNEELHEKNCIYYKEITSILLKFNNRPIVIIDWSGLTKCGKFHFLRASVAVGGRTLTLLDMTFQEKEVASPKAHKKFLEQLALILPQGCKPIIVTDAGFRCPWFKLILKYGWDFIGRVRNNTQYQKDNDNKWSSVKSLYTQAGTSPLFLLTGLLAKSNSVQCHFYVVKENKKNRIRKNLKGQKIQSSFSKKHGRRENEPLLVVTSLNPNEHTPKHIIDRYKKRMQIEEAFRDIKNSKNGLSMRHCRSYTLSRLNTALLIANIAMILLWIIGLSVKKQKKHYSYQANTIRHKNILSTFTIGWQYLRKQGKNLLKPLFLQALLELQYHVV